MLIASKKQIANALGFASNIPSYFWEIFIPLCPQDILLTYSIINSILSKYLGTFPVDCHIFGLFATSPEFALPGSRQLSPRPEARPGTGERPRGRGFEKMKCCPFVFVCGDKYASRNFYRRSQKRASLRLYPRCGIRVPFNASVSPRLINLPCYASDIVAVLLHSNRNRDYRVFLYALRLTPGWSYCSLPLHSRALTY